MKQSVRAGMDEAGSTKAEGKHEAHDPLAYDQGKQAITDSNDILPVYRLKIEG